MDMFKNIIKPLRKRAPLLTIIVLIFLTTLCIFVYDFFTIRHQTHHNKVKATEISQQYFDSIAKSYNNFLYELGASIQNKLEHDESSIIKQIKLHHPVIQAQLPGWVDVSWHKNLKNTTLNDLNAVISKKN